MKTMFGMLKVTLGVAVLATLFAQLAGAQCASVGAFKAHIAAAAAVPDQPVHSCGVLIRCPRRGRRYAEPQRGSDRRLLEGQPYLGRKF